MIVTAMLLIAIGSADVIRQFVSPRARRIALAVAGILVVLLSIAAGAWPAGVLAVACAAAWIWLLPTHASARARFWPAIVLALMCGGFVALLGSRHDVGLLGSVWSMASPIGALSLDKALLAIGAVLFLLESANLIVRAALREEMAMDAATSESDTPLAAPSKTLKGGRLIGPLERVLVFALTLAGMYTLLAAVLAAKGIVRFPEISRDRDAGNRAEYFLVGSMVSWVIALAAAFLVWWGFSTPGA